MNILQVQDQLKGLSQDQLVREMQRPSGNAPQYLVLSELNRRKKMQADMAAQQSKAPQTTVAQDAVAAAGVPQGGITALAANMAPKTDITGNTGASPVPPPMPSEAPVGMADGGYTPGSNSFRDMLETDPATIAMANRMGKSVSEYLDTLPDEVINANAARVIKAQEAAALGARTDVFDPSLPVLDQAAVGEFSLNPADPMRAIKDRALFEQGVNPSYAYDLAQQAYGIGISDRLPGVTSVADSAPVGGLFADPRARVAGAYGGTNYTTPMLGAPAAGGVYPGIMSEADRLLAASAGPMAPMALPFQGTPVANQSEAMPVLGAPAAGGVYPAVPNPVVPYANGMVDPAVLTLLDMAAPAVNQSQAMPEAYVPEDPLDAFGGVGPDIKPAFYDPWQNARPSTGGGAAAALARLKATDFTDPAVNKEAIDARIAELEPIVAAQEARAANEAAAGMDTGTPLTTADVVAPPASPDAVTTPSGGPNGGAGAGGTGGMSSFEQEIMDAIGRSEKRAEQDKWLALAQAGMEIMNAAGKQGTFAGAVGEGGAKGLAAFRQGRDEAENTRLGLLKELEASRMARAQLAARSAGGGSSRGALTMNQALSQAGDLMAQGQELVQMGTATKNADMVAQGEQIKAYAQSLMGMVFPTGTGGGGTIPTP